MRKVLMLFIALTALVPAFGQNALDNPYYKKSLEYRDMAEKAMNDSDYKKASEYARLGIAELDKYRSNNGILLAEQRIREARRRGLDKKDPDKFARILELVETAKTYIQAGDYPNSAKNSDEALRLLDELFSGAGLVSQYRVVKGDCLWRIARKPEIYDDAKAWPKIYMANKSRMRYPDNPHLIYPDQIFDIPR